jgi:hypothetical protein
VDRRDPAYPGVFARPSTIRPPRQERYASHIALPLCFARTPAATPLRVSCASYDRWDGPEVPAPPPGNATRSTPRPRSSIVTDRRERIEPCGAPCRSDMNGDGQPDLAQSGDGRECHLVRERDDGGGHGRPAGAARCELARFMDSPCRIPLFHVYDGSDDLPTGALRAPASSAPWMRAAGDISGWSALDEGAGALRVSGRWRLGRAGSGV